MSRPPAEDAPLAKSRAHRIVTAVFGAVLVLVALATVVWADESMLIGAGVAAAAIGWLGVDACISAWRRKRSLLERIGPLP